MVCGLNVLTELPVFAELLLDWIQLSILSVKSILSTCQIPAGFLVMAKTIFSLF